MIIAQAQIPFERQAVNPTGHAAVEFGVGFLGEHIGLGLSNHTLLNELFQEASIVTCFYVTNQS